VDLVAAALLGTVQGLTEFLPVSSSGHLILARAFFGWDPGRFGLAFDVACHVGTFLAIVAYYWRDVLRMLQATPAALRLGSGQALSGEHAEMAQLVRLIIVGTVPAVVVGLLFSDIVEGRARTPAVVAVTLAVGAIGLLVAEKLGRQDRTEASVTYMDALLIGTAQAAALVPGVSRSGATLTVALLLGLARPAAARFVFLLSLPAVAAAGLKEGLELRHVGIDALPLMLFAVGLFVSAVVGYLTITFFIRYLGRHSLNAFAAYRFALAAITVVWLLTR
jgi:undecaprenyl-diphosphatase